MMIIDTHAHLQMDQFDGDRQKVIDRAAKAGVEIIINASFDLDSSEKAVELAEENDNLYASVGVHPHDAKTLDNKTLDAFRELAKHPKVVAIGEMGLDYYRDLSPRPVQRSAFEKQLQLAVEVDLPVIIHNRDAHEDTTKILEQHVEKLNGVMHCFSGNIDFADTCIQMGLHISFAGPVTYPKSQELRDVAAHVPLDSFFVETDCPYLAPQFKRGKRNEPSYVKAVAKKISEVRRIAFSEVVRATTSNAIKLFNLTR